MKRHERRDTVPPTEKYEEYKVMPQFWAWVLLLAWSASLILWALWIHALVPSVDRTWDYGALPQTPAESIYSSVAPRPEAEPGEQLPAFPEAKPLEPPDREGGR